jgi:hypothetical protein
MPMESPGPRMGASALSVRFQELEANAIAGRTSTAGALLDPILEEFGIVRDALLEIAREEERHVSDTR